MVNLFARFRAWRAAKREAAKRQWYEDGWDWATKELLDGALPGELESKCSCSDEFDRGARSAIYSWRDRRYGKV